MMIKRLLLTAVLGATTSTVIADDWPQWRGPTRDGVGRVRPAGTI